MNCVWSGGSLSDEADLEIALVMADRILLNDGADPFLRGFSDDDFNRLGRHLGKFDSIDRAFDVCLEAVEGWAGRWQRKDLKGTDQDSHPGFVYVIRCGPYFKIGRTSKVERRMVQLGVQMPHPIEIVWTKHVSNMCVAEKFLHEMFSHKRMNGEWFNLNNDDLLIIKLEYED